MPPSAQTITTRSAVLPGLGIGKERRAGKVAVFMAF
jgi:hypothetical protein